MPQSRYDVAIVGASIAGCTAARLFAQAGARVALVERSPDPAAYKVVCTHSIQSSATPTIERLGLAPLLLARGALRTGAQLWTAYSGWIHIPDDVPRAWGVTRKTLDPVLRELAANTPGVELMLGQTLVELVDSHTIRTVDRDGALRTIAARLVVGADGRGSALARLARIPGRVRPHGRVFFFSYWRGVRPATTDIRGWNLDPDGAAQFPNEDDTTVMVASVLRERLPEFRADLEGAYARHMSQLADFPDLSEAERISKMIGKIDMPNVMRPAARDGIAFVGDAALASDPLWGVGCGWAFQSAEWLVDETAAALLDGADLDAALERYRRAFRRRLALHHFLIAEYAGGRKLYPFERSFFGVVPHDEGLQRALADVVSRNRQPLRLLLPDVTLGVLRATARG